MSTYYAISTSHPEADNLLRQVNDEYTAHKGRHWPLFSPDKSKLFIMLKPSMSDKLKEMLAGVALATSDDLKEVFYDEFNGEQPAKADVKELIARRKTLTEVVEAVRSVNP